MSKAVECIKCQAQMELGYVPDGTHGGYTQQGWFPGVPVKSFWMGLKMETNQLVLVTTFRCPNCGYLESYALPNATPATTVTEA